MNERQRTLLLSILKDESNLECAQTERGMKLILARSGEHVGVSRAAARLFGPKTQLKNDFMTLGSRFFTQPSLGFLAILQIVINHDRCSTQR